MGEGMKAAAVAELGGGICRLLCRSNRSLARAMDGRIMHAPWYH